MDNKIIPASNSVKLVADKHRNTRWKIQEITSYYDSFSGDHECLYRRSWQFIKYLMRYFSLDQSGPAWHKAHTNAIKHPLPDST